MGACAHGDDISFGYLEGNSTKRNKLCCIVYLQIPTDVVGEEDDEERGHEVVDSLNVAAGRVPHGPDEQNPLETLYHKQTLG